jgi:tRNA (mo5U34)-methyltransferase
VNEEDIKARIDTRPWYHIIEVSPGVTTPGRYDPRPVLDTMGFPESLAGKSVLDIGTCDGFFAFEAERRGAARVLATDRHPADHLGFAVARDLLGSKVEYAIASVYDLTPERFGTFDVVLFPGVLYHLRHPLLAIDRIHGVCREYAFVESHVLDGAFLDDGSWTPLAELHPALAPSAIMQFYPGSELNDDASNWFAPTVRCIELMLSTSGFRPRLAGRWLDRASFIAEREAFVQPDWY